jgi:hypothetical protein
MVKVMVGGGTTTVNVNDLEVAIAVADSACETVIVVVPPLFIEIFPTVLFANDATDVFELLNVMFPVQIEYGLSKYERLLIFTVKLFGILYKKLKLVSRTVVLVRILPPESVYLSFSL